MGHLLRDCCLALLLSLVPSMLLAQALFHDGFEGCHASCAAELTCAAQQSGQACIAGRFRGAEASTPICTVPSSAAVCTDTAVGGPCALAVRVYDSLDFIANPGGATPIAASETLVDGCGRFRISGFSVPDFGFALLLIDDAVGAADVYAPAAGIHAITSAQELEQTNLYAVRNSTDQRWTTTAGSPFGGNTFAQQGTYAAIFRHGDTPVAGVQVLSNGNAVSSNDYYFSDAQPLGRSTVDANLVATGTNGTALFVTSSTTTVTGSGSEPDGCGWPQLVGGSAPGLAVVREYLAHANGAPDTPCP